MFQNKMEKAKLIHGYLSSIGCCEVCILRFLRGRGNDFLDVKKSLKSVIILFHNLTR
jgi:hypothetical protein